MFVINAPVAETIELENQIFLLKIYSPEIASIILPGQFLNIRVSESYFPLLRRPFSVCDVENEHFYIMFNVYGEGTKILAHKHPGQMIDVLGPLGNGFNLKDDYETAVIIAGGLGAAPFPYVTRKISGSKNIITFINGRTHSDLIRHGMVNIKLSTDDGSEGFKGTVVQLFRNSLDELNKDKIKVFGCGPNAMLGALKELCISENIDCEVSTECAMACGFGICQGCPIESTHQKDKYLLVCKHGPVFNIKDIVI
ncbi:MAG TPA: dihydroorotate dehydrogenase electron transfer subunit [Ignavibacteriaceae bacterium]|nr:dihydroorotate dehydrogenase electron transfer subunit [Ignavibacteriaceae bacterium]